MSSTPETIKAEVRKDLLPVFRSRIEKIEKAARKLDLSPPVVIEGGTILKRYRPVQQPNGITVYRPADRDEWAPVEWEFVEVEVAGFGRPVIEGWTFVAVIEHTEAGNILRKAPWAEDVELDEDFRTASPKCDHCGYERDRKDTYIVRSEDGEQLQVGSTCLKDFTGHRDPLAITRYFDQLLSLAHETWGEADPDAPKGEALVATEQYLAVVAQLIDEGGWVSKGKAWDCPGKTATAEDAWLAFFTPRRDGKSIDAWVTDEATDRAAKALAWAREVEADNDYLLNLQVAVSNDYVSERRTGLVASAVVAFEKSEQRRLEREAETADAEPLTPFVGERITIEGEVIKTATRESRYGLQYKIIVLDDRGFKVWGTVPSSIADEAWQSLQGRRVRFDAKIAGTGDEDEYFGFYSRPTRATLLG